jgi:type I restriction enzyme S subunit
MANKFPPSWKLLPLENCMAVIIDYRGITPKKSSFGVPLITAKIVKSGRLLDLNEYIPAEDYDDWMRRGLPEPGDVVMTTEAPLGEIAQLDDRKVALAQRLITLRGKPNLIDNTFLKFLMMSDFIQDQLKARSTGTTVLGIKQSELRKVTLAVPPLGEQRTIAHIMGTLDEKIELNRRMNINLESIIQGVYRAWFEEYDGVDEWDVVPLPAIFDINPLRFLKKEQIAPYLDMSNMPTQGHRAIQWINRPYNSGTKFINGDTLLARITPCLENGKTAFVDFLEESQTGWGSTEYIIFRPKPPLPPEYGYYLARSENLRNYAIQNMTGTSGRQRTPASCFANFSIAVPPADIANQFGDIAKSVMAMVKSNDEEARTLNNIRNALLPKLMTGKIRIHHSSFFLEAN